MFMDWKIDLKESYNEIFLKTQHNDQTTQYHPCLSCVYLSTNILPSFTDEAFGKRVIILETEIRTSNSTRIPNKISKNQKPINKRE